MATIAVIGAGLSGLVVARDLADRHVVTVFEKSRGVGGRMATRRADRFEFDHGAQFFTAQTPAFRSFLEPLIDAGVVADWQAAFVELHGGEVTGSRQWDAEYPHYVGTPGMSVVGKTLAAGLDVRLQTFVASLSRQGEKWRLASKAGESLGDFDWVIVTVPAAQAADLLAGTSLASSTNVSMLACFALMLGFEESLALPWQAALVHDAEISWISVNSSKPGRPDATSLVVHATNAWADAHIDDDIETVQSHLIGAVSEASGIESSGAAHIAVHRWRYANVDRQEGEPFALDPSQKLAACGDWFVRGRVEAAFSSARTLIERLKRDI